MFLWCAFCQSFIGESAPLSDYTLTHGACAACEDRLVDGAYDLSSEVLTAKDLLTALRKAADSGQNGEVRELIDKAIDAKLRRSDVLLGILQPALYYVGQQWESGLLTPAEEHRFTAWCEEVLAAFQDHEPTDERPEILLAVAPDNAHNLGVRFLTLFLRDHGVRARAVTGQDIESVLDRIEENPPAYFGISVALPTAVDEAIDLARRIDERTGGATRVLLGGFAFREGDAGAPAELVVRTTQDLLEAVKEAA